MFWRTVRAALLRQRGKRLMIAFTIALGASLATAMLNVMFDVGDKVNQELKTYGANITVRPTGSAVLDELYGVDDGLVADASLREDELGNIKTIFWALNIVDFAPFLTTDATLADQQDEVELVGTWFTHHLDLPTGESVDTGMAAMRSWWDVTGAWPSDSDGGAMVGSAVAARDGLQVGDTVTVTAHGRSADLVVRGVFDSGGEEDEQVFVPLPVVQDLADRAGEVGWLEVSALTTPDNELSRRAAQNPSSLSITDWETWYCTAYVSSIAYQIEEVVTDSVARPVRQVAESEGAILEKTQLLMVLITLLSLAGSALGISNLVTASVMERAPEIGLLKAVGAQDNAVLRLILTEILVVGTVGGIVGYGAGLGFAQIIGQSVFGSTIHIKPAVIPLVAAGVSLVVLAGSLPSIRMLLRLRPAEVLHGR